MTVKYNLITHTFDNWEDLSEHLNTYSSFPWYIFRGQRNSKWLLESTLSRELKKVKDPNKTKLAQEHLDRFKLNIRGRRGFNPPFLLENELWALGQHFGLYTPLLDWSQSPYVALFFALSSNEKSETDYRSLWCLNTSDIDRINHWHKINQGDDALIIELVNPNLDENNRLVNQNGLFTKMSVDADIESWATTCKESVEYEVVVKINISEKIRDEALLFLDLMNINYSSLFPDLIGSSLDANIRIEQVDYLKERRDAVWDEYRKMKSVNK